MYKYLKQVTETSANTVTIITNYKNNYRAYFSSCAFKYLFKMARITAKNS